MTNSTSANIVYPVANAAASTKVFVDVFMTRDPTSNDIQYTTQQKWLNTSTGAYWILQGFTPANSAITANWIQIGSKNIAISFVTNSGTAVPSAGVLNILGGTGMTTSGSGDTVTVTLSTPVSLANGGTNASLTASNGGIFYSTATAGAILSGTATANQMLQSGSSTAPTWSTSTWPATTTINQVLYSSASNVVGGITAADNGVLISGTTGIPSWLANSGTAGYVLTANSGAPPSWQLSGTGSSINIQTFTSSGTYTPTAGMQYCLIEAVGGGGGGGGCAQGNDTAAGGGGGGGYSKGVFSSTTIGASQTVTIGAAGSAGSSGSNSGGSGGTTSVGSLISATGGSGGSGSASNAYAPGGAGGSGSSGNLNTTGTPGAPGIIFSNSTPNYGCAGGNGGSSFFGGGGIGAVQISAAGGGATSYGGGGGGGADLNNTSARAGGAGKAGFVIVTEFI